MPESRTQRRHNRLGHSNITERLKMFTYQVRVAPGCTYTMPLTRRTLREGESLVINQEILNENRDVFDILKTNALTRVKIKPGMKHRSGEVLGNQMCYVTDAELAAFGNKFEILAEDDQEQARVAIPDDAGVDVVFDLSAAALALAEQHGIDVSQIQGTGAGGRIVKSDIEAVVANGDA